MLIEGLRDKIKMVADGHGAILKEIQTFRENIFIKWNFSHYHKGYILYA